MNILETARWCLQLPDEWTVEEDEDGWLIYDRDEVGQIEISMLCREQGDVEESEVIALADDAERLSTQSKSIRWYDIRGFYYQWHEDNHYIREWYLYNNGVILLATYSCAEDNAGMDDPIVDEFLATLVIFDSEQVLPSH